MRENGSEKGVLNGLLTQNKTKYISLFLVMLGWQWGVDLLEWSTISAKKLMGVWGFEHGTATREIDKDTHEQDRKSSVTNLT